MYSYNSFTNIKEILLENKEDQIAGVIDFIQKGIIEAEGKYFWSEETQSINFNTHLIITSDFEGKSFKELPFKIGSCYNLSVDYGHLRSLEGSPISVNNFSASYNLIKSLKGCPKFVDGYFKLENNMLSDLNYGPYIIMGGSKLSYNPNLERKKINGVNIITLFNNMHEDIFNIYGTAEKGISIDSSKKIFEKISIAIENKEYAKSLIFKNPYYSEFLGEFKSEIEEFKFLMDIKDMDLI